MSDINFPSHLPATYLFNSAAHNIGHTREGEDHGAGNLAAEPVTVG
jgi:hypothetical protein